MRPQKSFHLDFTINEKCGPKFGSPYSLMRGGKTEKNKWRNTKKYRKHKSMIISK
jgi:hypothetical protein